MKKTLFKVIVGIVIVVALFFAYKVFFGGSADGGEVRREVTREDFSNSSLVPAITAEESVEFLATLNNLRGVTLDGSIFDSPAFLSLVDLSVELASQETGRPNPFLPINRGEISVPAEEGDLSGSL